MSKLSPALAAGGPVAPVSVSGSNLTWVWIVAVIALLALGVAYVLVREVLAASKGTEKMQEIAKAVQDGAAAYLRRQFRTLSIFVVLIFFILLVLPADGDGVTTAVARGLSCASKAPASALLYLLFSRLVAGGWGTNSSLGCSSWPS